MGVRVAMLLKMADFFIKEDLFPVTNYRLNLAGIKKNGVKVLLAAGKRSLAKKRFYAQTAPILARLVNCETVVFLGYHTSFEDEPED
jgi:hypothetical protein